jgi:serine protease Do
VVNVDDQTRPGSDDEDDEELGELWEHFFGKRGRPESRENDSTPRERLNQGVGSGFIIDPKGVVLTNNHVVEDAVSIRLALEDGRQFDAEVVGRDPLTDLALLRIKGTVAQLPSLKLGDSEGMRVGDWVVAIGNPFGLTSSVSVGIISARAREIGASYYDEFLQTDAAINPGNSGGPLFNLKGEVIGINTAIVGGGTGIGFAVPSNLAKALLPQLQKEGIVSRGWLGVTIQSLNPGLARALKVPVSEGAVVLKLDEGPAKHAGIRLEDVIVELDGLKISSDSGLTRAVGLRRPNATVPVKLFREGKPLHLKVNLGLRPDIEQVGAVRPAPAKHKGTPQSIGLGFQDVDPRMRGMGVPAGALVRSVEPNSPAEKAGFEPGQVVIEVSRKPVKSAQELTAALKGAKSKETLLLKVQDPMRENRLELLPLDVP